MARADGAVSIFGPRRYALENVPPALSWDEGQGTSQGRHLGFGK